MTEPLFLMGVPKSGTTLLQRVLARHSRISSASEPWILLPPLHALKEAGQVSVYGSQSCFHALHRTIDALPQGRADYRKAVAAMARSIYDDLSDDGDAYFLDKTPRYHLIADELVETFPNARFLFIWRNPLSVMASTILHNDDRIRGLRFAAFDLSCGYDNLVRAKAALGDRACAVSYESFVASPEPELRKIVDFLELGLEPAQMSDFSDVRFAGGDRNGIDRTTIETGSTERWKTVLSTPARRHLAGRILAQMDADALAACGYDKHALEEDLASLKMRKAPSHYTEFAALAAAEAYLRLQYKAISSGDKSALLY